MNENNWFEAVYSKKTGVDLERVRQKTARWKKAVIFSSASSIGSIIAVVVFGILVIMGKSQADRILVAVLTLTVWSIISLFCSQIFSSILRKTSEPIQKHEEAWKKLCGTAGFDNPTAEELGVSLMYKARDILRLEEEVAYMKRSARWDNPTMHGKLHMLKEYSRSLDEELVFLDSVGIAMHRGDLFRAAARK